jgi:5-methylcytosine-specific restriction endonuclease McrA
MNPQPKKKRISLNRNSVAWNNLVKEVFLRDGFICQKCREPFSFKCLAPHHVKSVGSGGDDTAENLISVCKECHYKIHNGNIKNR